ncbi:MAG: phage holin family protein [Vagococcus sp.]|uniref:phage holin family protein n=1 Tax=Vagococcus sp. TaxID=1933889 RepID=UPI002FC8ED4F
MVIISFSDVILEVQSLLNNFWFHIFIWSVIFDIGTGIVKGFVIKDSNSTKGLLGLIKHLLVVLLVLTAIPYLNLANLHTIAESFLIFFTVVYAISIVENWGQLGLPLPNWVKGMLTKLKATLDEEPTKSTEEEK